MGREKERQRERENKRGTERVVQDRVREMGGNRKRKER